MAGLFTVALIALLVVLCLYLDRLERRIAHTRCELFAVVSTIASHPSTPPELRRQLRHEWPELFDLEPAPSIERAS